jgi:hypothetical protein
LAIVPPREYISLADCDRRTFRAREIINGHDHGHQVKTCLSAGPGSPASPPTIELAEGTYHLDRVFKHDFFAATMRYRGADDAVVLKLGRQARLFGLPLSWIGRWHAAHETRMYRALGDLEVVPAFRGRYGKTGFVHAYVPGEPLTRKMPVADDFFDRLRAGIGRHARPRLRLRRSGKMRERGGGR